MTSGPAASLHRSAEERLRAAGCVDAAEEAAMLGGNETWLQRREAGEPLPWIVGRVTFCGREVAIEPGVYVPRPQTEELALRARALGGTTADLCTGSGAVAMVTGAIGVDLDLRAAAVARRNGVRAVVGDLDAPLRTGSFDVVTAVAPYVPTEGLPFLPHEARAEPVRAVDGGADGLAVVRRVVTGAARILRSGGRLLLELGADQDRLLARDLDAAGFDAVATWRDDEGDLRGLDARRR